MESRNKEEKEGEEVTSLEKFQDLIKDWENNHSTAGYDPTKLLENMAEILEKETHIYMASDPGNIILICQCSVLSSYLSLFY